MIVIMVKVRVGGGLLFVLVSFRRDDLSRIWHQGFIEIYSKIG